MWRGLGGVKRAMFDAHSALTNAIEIVSHGASWQGCQVHIMRNVLSVVPSDSQARVAEVSRALQRCHPKFAVMLDDVLVRTIGNTIQRHLDGPID
jgi:transposase-like protein